MQTRRTFIGLLVGLFAVYSVAVAQPGEKLIKVNIAPQHGDWVYKPGETVKFDVSVTKNNVLLPNVEISYECGPEMLPPVKKDKLTLKDGKTVIDAGTMKIAGFLRCRVYARYDGKNYEGLATAAVSPETIQPTTTQPADFVQFWDKAKSELANIPLDARMTLLPERCTNKVNVYHVNIQNFQNARLYGILCVPKAQGKYPAILKVPGAGVRQYYGDVANAEKGAITLEIGIHGIPVTMDPGVYIDLGKSALNGYQLYNLDDKDRYYYKRVYLGCVRAVDFIFSMPEFDGANVVVSGGSQGGALAIVTAGLDSRIKGLVSFYPALCDLTGYLNGRAGGWPHMFNDPVHNTPAKVETSKYYDVVNFARQVKVPGFYSWGYNDVTCPPTSMYAAYNVIQAPRTLYLAEETGHWTYPEQWEKSTKWMFDLLTPEMIKSYNIDFNWGEGGLNGFAAPGLWADANPQEHIKWYEDLGCNFVQTFAVSCNGYAWYKNGVVPEQPGLKHDFLTEMVKLGHERNMKVFGYFCAGANVKWGIDHPDLSYGVSGPHIPFTTQYLDYLCASIKDALEKTKMDGFMIDWIWNPGATMEPYPPLKWLACEQQMFVELMSRPFPGVDNITPELEKEFRRKAIARCWRRVHDTAKKTNPNCLIWVTCCQVTSSDLEGSEMFKEADIFMNEEGDISHVEGIRNIVGQHTRLLTCLANWNKQNPAAIIPQAIKANIGLFGFTKPHANSLLPPVSYFLSKPIDEFEGDERNIAYLARIYNDLPLNYVKGK